MDETSNRSTIEVLLGFTCFIVGVDISICYPVLPVKYLTYST